MQHFPNPSVLLILFHSIEAARQVEQFPPCHPTVIGGLLRQVPEATLAPVVNSAIDAIRAGSRGNQTGEYTYEGGLSCSIGTKESEYPTLINRQGDSVESLYGSVPLPEIAYFNNRHRFFSHTVDTIPDQRD